jgi:hypothetical protein
LIAKPITTRLKQPITIRLKRWVSQALNPSYGLRTPLDEPSPRRQQTTCSMFESQPMVSGPIWGSSIGLVPGCVGGSRAGGGEAGGGTTGPRSGGSSIGRLPGCVGGSLEGCGDPAIFLFSLISRGQLVQFCQSRGLGLLSGLIRFGCRRDRAPALDNVPPVTASMDGAAPGADGIGWGRIGAHVWKRGADAPRSASASEQRTLQTAPRSPTVEPKRTRPVDLTNKRAGNHLRRRQWVEDCCCG